MRSNLDLKLLIIDDDPDILGILSYDFQQLKCQVDTATGSAEGLEKLKQNHYHVVIADLRLAEGGGEELLFACSQMPIELKPSFVLMTGAVTEFNEELAHHLGAEGFIRKPFTRKVLNEVVNRISLPVNERWKVSPIPIPADCLRLEVQLDDLNQSMQSKTFKLGRGGLFVALQEGLPTVGDVLGFDVKLPSEKMRLVGSGVVRWNRTEALKDAPAGIGLEILQLDEGSEHDFALLQAKYPTRAYIPRM